MGGQGGSQARRRAAVGPGLAGAIALLLGLGLLAVTVHHQPRRVSRASRRLAPAAGAAPSADLRPSVAAQPDPPTSTLVRPTTVSVPLARLALDDRILTDTIDRLTVAVPASWRTLPVDSTALTAAVRSVTASAPELAPLLSQPSGQATTGSLRLLAVQVTSPAMVLGIVSTPAPAGVTLDQLAQSSPSSPPPSSGASTGLTVQRLVLPAGDALQLSLLAPYNGQQLLITQDVLLHNGQAIVLQLGTVGPNPTNALFNHILGTLHFH